MTVASAPPIAPSSLPAGRVVGGRYTLESVIGEGASGTVYAARRDDGVRVALKVLHRHLLSDRQIFGRFRREAAILKRLEGPHVARLLDFVEDDGLLAIALEHVDGVSLETRLHESPVTLAEAVEITLQVCAALGAAHAAGIVHRDLKPANVLVEGFARQSAGDGEPSPRSSEGDLLVRVVDFGLAKVVHGEKSTTGLTEQDMIFGTPEYMAPEQARGDEVDARCDLYATGIMLYEMAVGRVPFSGRTPIAAMTAHLVETPRPPRAAAPERGIGLALETVILRAIAKEPEDRYATARELAEALSAARDEPLVIAPGGTGSVPDAAELATSDTDLHVRTSAIEPRKAAADTLASATAEGEADRGRWVWVLVAVVFAIAGVAVGALFGAR